MQEWLQYVIRVRQECMLLHTQDYQAVFPNREECIIGRENAIVCGDSAADIRICTSQSISGCRSASVV